MSLSRPEPPPATDAAVIAGFWRAVALAGWHGLTMRDVAAEAGMTLAALRRRFDSPLAILEAHGRAVDAAVLDGTVEDAGATPRDRLFDILMRRLDELQPHRDGVARLLRDLPATPLLALWLGARLPCSMAWMLEAAGIEASGPRGLARAKGLGLVWLRALRAWEKDDSPDLSATMAALDRALDQADRAARSFGLAGREPPSAPQHSAEPV